MSFHPLIRSQGLIPPHIVRFKRVDRDFILLQWAFALEYPYLYTATHIWPCLGDTFACLIGTVATTTGTEIAPSATVKLAAGSFKDTKRALGKYIGLLNSTFIREPGTVVPIVVTSMPVATITSFTTDTTDTNPFAFSINLFDTLRSPPSSTTLIGRSYLGSCR